VSLNDAKIESRHLLLSVCNRTDSVRSWKEKESRAI
jgi:hypothetical protein